MGIKPVFVILKYNIIISTIALQKLGRTKIIKRILCNYKLNYIGNYEVLSNNLTYNCLLADYRDQFYHVGLKKTS